MHCKRMVPTHGSEGLLISIPIQISKLLPSKSTNNEVDFAGPKC